MAATSGNVLTTTGSATMAYLRTNVTNQAGGTVTITQTGGDVTVLNTIPVA